MTDSQILAQAQQEVITSSSLWNSEISNERAAALDYYLGEKYGDEAEGRSQVVTREVMETVEWILPSLVRIFCDADNMVTFDPTGPEDEDQAEQESDVANYVFWKQNKGFYNAYTALKDALLSKTGILKVWWEDGKKEEREEYRNLTDVGMIQLMQDPSISREVLEVSQNDDGTFDASFKAMKNRGKVRIEPVAPEDFGISADASSPYAKDARSCFHRVKKTKSELISDGFKKSVVESLPTGEDFLSAEQLARNDLEDSGMANVFSRDVYWVTEVYFYADKNEDGIDELLKVTYAGDINGGGAATLLEIEEVDRIPFCTATPVILTHKFYGLSIADLTMDLQHIKSTLLRQVLDNTYLANNSRTIVNDEYVNMDDLLTSRPGGVVRVRGEQSVAAYITPVPHNALPPETFQVMGYIDDQLKQRTGVGDEVAGLDKNSLANVNTGVAALAYDAARMKIELVARIMGEIMFLPLFKDIHELMSKNQDQPLVMKLRNQWVNVNPGEWRERENVTVNVGVGNATRERRIMTMQQIIQLQGTYLQAGGMGKLVKPEQIWFANKELVKAMGMDPEMFFTDPRSLPPEPPPQPSAQDQAAMVQAQALMLDAQSKMARAQVDAQKIQSEERRLQIELMLKAKESALKQQISELQVQLKGMRDKADSDNKVLSMEVEMKRRATENNLKLLQIQLAEMSKAKDRALEKYKADQDMTVEMAKLAMDQANEILPGGMIVDDVEMSKMFAFGDEQPIECASVEIEEVEEPRKPDETYEDEPIEEEKKPDDSAKALAVMAEAIVRLEQKLRESEAAEVEKIVMRDENGLITSIVEKRRA